jgi:hypothetical protein
MRGSVTTFRIQIESSVAKYMPRGHLLVRVAVAATLVLVVGFGVVRYPLPPGSLALPLLAYAAVLWWRPVSFLLILPCVLPAWDLGLWTGWVMVEESDFFVLTTVAVLLIRSPPHAADLFPRGLPGAVLLVFVTFWVIATITGLTSRLGAPSSDIVFLRPDNAIRLAKGLVGALVLFPFLRQRERSHADAVSWLGGGMALGIAAVTIIVAVERALFTGTLDFTGAYRVSGPFTSMRFGGGYIGAYFALALPMALCLARIRSRWLGMGLLLLTYLLGGYGLAVTFARTAYAAALIGTGVAGISWLLASRGSRKSIMLAAAPILLIVTILGVAGADTGMRQRFLDSAKDYTTREGNWRAGLLVRDKGVLPTLFGMGLGTYSRAAEMRSLVDRPGDIAVRQDAEGAYVAMRIEAPLYLGEKVNLPGGGSLHLNLQARSDDDLTTLGISLCDKVLLYSDHCRGDGIAIGPSGDGLRSAWQTIEISLPVNGLGEGLATPGLRWLRRPVELSLFGGPSGHHVDIRNVRLSDDKGQEVLANGDFSHGLDRWTVTDDDHLAWRMKNAYLMLVFQTGILGLLAFLLLSGLALAGGIRTATRGSVTGAAVAGSVVSFLVSGLFDDVVEPTRLATLLFLISLSGLVQWETSRTSPDLPHATEPNITIS